MVGIVIFLWFRLRSFLGLSLLFLYLFLYPMPEKYPYSFDSVRRHRGNICPRAATLRCKDLLSSTSVAVQNWWFGPTRPPCVRFQHRWVWRWGGNWEDAAASRAFSIALTRSELWARVGSLGPLLRFFKIIDRVCYLHSLTLVQTQAMLASYFRCLGYFYTSSDFDWNS